MDLIPASGISSNNPLAYSMALLALVQGDLDRHRAGGWCLKIAIVVLTFLLCLSGLAAEQAWAQTTGGTLRWNVPVMTASKVEPALPPVTLPATSPAAPVEPVVLPVAIATPKPETQHRFFDRTNSFAFAALAAGLSGDALSTQKGLAYPGFHEMNPLARPFVQSRTGAAFYTAGSLAFLSGGMYLAHQTGHHRWERISPFIVAGWEGMLTVRNYRLVNQAVSKH